MSSKSLAAFAFVCLAPVAAFAQSAPVGAPAKAPVAAVTAPAVAAPVAKAAAPATTATPSTTTAAVTADGSGSNRWQTCAADVQKFCGTVEKGKGVVRACLESHAAELTPACKTSMADHAAAHAARAAEKGGGTVKQ